MTHTFNLIHRVLPLLSALIPKPSVLVGTIKPQMLPLDQAILISRADGQAENSTLMHLPEALASQGTGRWYGIVDNLLWAYFDQRQTREKRLILPIQPSAPGPSSSVGFWNLLSPTLPPTPNTTQEQAGFRFVLTCGQFKKSSLDLSSSLVHFSCSFMLAFLGLYPKCINLKAWLSLCFPGTGLTDINGSNS